MSLQLLPLEEEDIPVFARIVAVAFSDGLMEVLYSGGFGEKQLAWYSKKLLHDFRQGNATRFNKIVDTSLPDDDPDKKIISVAKWSFYATERSEAELDAEEKDDEKGMEAIPGANLELMDAFHGEMARNRRRVWGGKPYVLLHLLGTHPDHHRRGSGARQLEWGIAAAEQLNLPVWLEASAAGKPLYERHGFHVVDKVDFDAQRWGLSKDFVSVNMLRPVPKAEPAAPSPHVTTILVLGAGELGNAMLIALAAHPSVRSKATRVAVLLRSGSKSIETVKRISPAFAVLAEDIASAPAETLADHFKLFDGIINCTGFAGGSGTQTKITAAVSLAGQAAQGPMRYIPWQFGVDYDVFGRGGRMELWDEQLDVRDMLRASTWPKNVAWTIVSTGIFTSFIFEEAFGVVTGLKSTGPVLVQALGGLNNQVTATTVEDIGTITVDVLFDHATSNQVVYTSGQTFSYRELAAEIESTLNGRRQVILEEKSVAELEQELNGDASNAYKKYRVVFAEGRGVSWDPTETWNARKGIETSTVREWLIANVS